MKNVVLRSENKSKASYVFGGLSFIPLIGVLFGILAVVLGVKNKQKMPIVLGVAGAIFTFVLYGSLFYFGFVAKYGPYHELKKQLVEQMLNDNRGMILIYKERHNKLPESLSELGDPSPGNLFYLYDPWMNPISYTINEDGSFTLRSIGPDGIPNTKDDIASYE